jgi:hypothetical protein
VSSSGIRIRLSHATPKLLGLFALVAALGGCQQRENVRIVNETGVPLILTMELADRDWSGGEGTVYVAVGDKSGFDLTSGFCVVKEPLVVAQEGFSLDGKRVWRPDPKSWCTGSGGKQRRWVLALRP